MIKKVRYLLLPLLRLASFRTHMNSLESKALRLWGISKWKYFCDLGNWDIRSIRSWFLSLTGFPTHFAWMREWMILNFPSICSLYFCYILVASPYILFLSRGLPTHLLMEIWPLCFCSMDFTRSDGPCFFIFRELLLRPPSCLSFSANHLERLSLVNYSTALSTAFNFPNNSLIMRSFVLIIPLKLKPKCLQRPPTTNTG